MVGPPVGIVHIPPYRQRPAIRVWHPAPALFLKLIQEEVIFILGICSL
jgi:hypothetical protein